MMGDPMTLPERAELPQFLANILASRRERFVTLCRSWGSAEALASDLSEIGHIVSARKCTSWRNRTFGKLPDADIQAVKLAVQFRKLNAAQAHARTLREASAL